MASLPLFSPPSHDLLSLGQWFQTFLMLQLFNVEVAPTIKLLLLLLHYCSFATAINSTVKTCVFWCF